MENDVLTFKYRKGIKEIYPAHKFVSNWLFAEDDESEALLAHHVAVIAEKNGLTPGDMFHVFPLILRMLKSDSNWAL